MCSIGTLAAVPICTAVSGATDAPMTTTTTAAPCADQYSNCGDYARYCSTYEQISTGCPVTCNTCSTSSATTEAPCADEYSNCGDYASYCGTWDVVTTSCPLTCNTCQTKILVWRPSIT